MQAFQIKPVIKFFDSYAECLLHVDFVATDCIFTVHALYEQWLKPLNLASGIILYEDYGTGEPTDHMVDRILSDFHQLDCCRVIAIGGGSVMDVAKLLALKPTMDSTLELFEGKKQAIKEKELILVPSTCGTGSEMTCISILGIPSKSTKKGLAVPALFADTAVLIPELLYHLPKEVLITSSLDALTHAMESFVSPKANSYSELFSMEAIHLLLRSYATLLSKEHEWQIKDIADDLLTASNYAGIAFGNAGVGAVHALAYPLGDKYHVFHGEACARFFSAVFQVYRNKKPDGKMRQLTHMLAQHLDVAAQQEPWEALDTLLNRLLPEKPLRDYGMLETDIDVFADSVIREQQRLLVNNYLPLNRDEIHGIFQRLW